MPRRRRDYEREGSAHLQAVVESLRGWRADLVFLVNSGVPKQAVARAFGLSLSWVTQWFNGKRPDGVYLLAIKRWAEARRKALEAAGAAGGDGNPGGARPGRSAAGAPGGRRPA